MRELLKLAAVLAVLAAPISGQASAEPPKVVASIAPVHSLVAGVMRGIGRPTLLLRGGASPHTFSLRPSDAKALASAHIVFWIGEDMERFLVRPLKTLARKAEQVELAEAKGLRVFKVREGGAWPGHEDHDSAHKEEHAKGQTKDHDEHHAHGEIDAHLWLDPRNAKAMTAAIATALIKADRANAAAYLANATRLAEKLDALDRELDRTLAPVRGARFIVFHDAYQYFERRYRLSAAGAITLDPGRTPGARRVSQIRKTIRDRQARCVFSEPQFRPSIVTTVIEGTPARAATLDPLGARIKPGEVAYFVLMRRLAADLVACLTSK